MNAIKTWWFSTIWTQNFGFSYFQRGPEVKASICKWLILWSSLIQTSTPRWTSRPKTEHTESARNQRWGCTDLSRSQWWRRAFYQEPSVKRISITRLFKLACSIRRLQIKSATRPCKSWSRRTMLRRRASNRMTHKRMQTRLKKMSFTRTLN